MTGAMLDVVHGGVARARKYLHRAEAVEPGEQAPAYGDALQRIRAATRLVDLGCGGNPHPRAAVAVDAFRAPLHRVLGDGPTLDAATFERRGIPFVQADLNALPFADHEFDFAYSHHVFEHLVDPKQACAEMCRVARAGVIFTPSIFSEVAFGRPYHLWFVMARGRRLVFLRKSAGEDRPFGEHPEWNDRSGRYRETLATNPFEMLLNDAGWYQGRERMGRLSRRLRAHWYSHSWVTEVTFVWEGSFDCTVIHEDGRIE